LITTGVLLPGHLIGFGTEDFRGREKQMAFYVISDAGTHYGWCSLDPLEYTGPPLVLGSRAHVGRWIGLGTNSAGGGGSRTGP
jgi:hypothetical protein